VDVNKIAVARMELIVTVNVPLTAGQHHISDVAEVEARRARTEFDRENIWYSPSRYIFIKRETFIKFPSFTSFPFG